MSISGGAVTKEEADLIAELVLLLSVPFDFGSEDNFPTHFL